MPDTVQDAWIERVFGIRLPPPPLDTASLTRRLVALRDAFTAAGTLRDHADGLRSAAAALKAQDPAATTLIAALEDAARQPALAPGPQARPDTVDLPTDRPPALPRAVVKTAARLRQHVEAAEAAVEAAAANLEAACRAMLQTPAFAGDPSTELPEVEAAVAAVGERVPSFAATASAITGISLRLAEATDAAQRRQLVASALGAIASYRQALDQEPLLADMEGSEAGSFAIRGPILAALSVLEDALDG